MQVREQCGHLRIGESAGEAGHQVFAGENDVPHPGICGRSATGQLGMLEDSVKIGRNRLEIEIIVLVAMRASHHVEMLAFGLFRREPRRRVASRSHYREQRAEDNHP